jgi:hypothetical protein
VPTWLSAHQMARVLGISTRTLRRWRDSDRFVPGEHYRRKGPNPESEVIYHAAYCVEAIKEFTRQSETARLSK